MSEAATAERPARTAKSNQKAAGEIAASLKVGLAAVPRVEDGAAHAREFLQGLRRNPSHDSVMLIGYLDEVSHYPESEKEAFAEVLQQELARGLSPDSEHSLKRNPMIDSDPAETATNIGDAISFLSLAEACVRADSDLGDSMENGICRLKDCISRASHALAADLQKRG